MSLLGMYDVATGTVEGAEDPGHLFQKKHHHVMSILHVMGLLHLKGCDLADKMRHPQSHLFTWWFSQQCLDSSFFWFGCVCE